MVHTGRLWSPGRKPTKEEWVRGDLVFSHQERKGESMSSCVLGNCSLSASHPSQTLQRDQLVFPGKSFSQAL